MRRHVPSIWLKRGVTLSTVGLSKIAERVARIHQARLGDVPDTATPTSNYVSAWEAFLTVQPPKVELINRARQ
jgi:hypothetical protein